MRIHELFLFFLGLSLSCANVIQLSDKNFDQILAEYPIVMVNFYADWCHFCRALAPIYESVGESFGEDTKNKKVAITKVDSVSQVALSQKYGVNKFPTLKLFVYGTERKPEYRGERTLEALSKYIRDIQSSQYSVIPYVPSGINDIHTAGDEVSFIAVLRKNDKNSLQVFDKVSRICGGTSKFYVALGPDNIEEKIYYKEDDILKSEKSMNGVDSKIIVDWVKHLATPFVRELTFLNAEEITEEGKPLLVFFYNSLDLPIRQKFRSFVKDKLSHIDSVTFLTADGQTFLHPLTHLGKSMSDLPLLVIDSFQHMYTYNKPIAGIFEDPSLLDQFVKDLHSGKLHREYHYGSEDSSSSTTRPPESVFKKLAPNENRYSIKDEF